VAQYGGVTRVVGVWVLLGAYNNKHHFNPSRSSALGLVDSVREVHLTIS